MLDFILTFLSVLLEIYTLICFIYILMSWFPGARYTKFGTFIAAICEPYLGFFSRRGWFRFGNIDFSPILSIGLLTLASTVLGTLKTYRKIHFGWILGAIIGMIWNLVSTLLTIFLILLIIRWVVLLVNHGQTSPTSLWNQVDNMINRITYKISGTFIKKPHKYQTSLLISWISILVINFAGRYLISLLVLLCNSIPF